MSRRRPGSALVASPILVGAVTLLVTIIAVFIAYNANAGLPFVPTYDVEAEIPSGAKLVAGNDVRVGGFRVGVVEEIKPSVVEVDGDRRTIALIEMKLDKSVEPLRANTHVEVRPRSALGLKYVELTPGRRGEELEPGATIALENSDQPLELEDIYEVFDDDTRADARAATQGFGDAFGGRGSDLNNTIAALRPFFEHLAPVARNLSASGTDLDRFFPELAEFVGQIAPVAEINAALFTDMADTFAALSASPESLRATIERSPPTLDAAISSFRTQRPFLADFADLSGRLRPAVQALPRSLPAINRAFAVGTPVLPRTVPLNQELGDTFGALEDLFKNPDTLLALRDLGTAISVSRPALEFIAPYQTVCNYANYFIHPLGEHQSQTALGGTVQNQGVKLVNLVQPNTLGNTESSRPWDTLPGEDPRGATFAGEPAGRIYVTPYYPAIDAQGNADCQLGQTGWIRGPLAEPYTRYEPGVLSDGTPTGRNGGVAIDNFPGLAGGTYVTRALGIQNLQDVP